MNPQNFFTIPGLMRLAVLAFLLVNLTCLHAAPKN
jgi:hypothetical protein